MDNGIDVLCHDAYEINRGVKPLAFITTNAKNQECIEEKLKSIGIAYEIHKLPNSIINVYFGDRNCVEIIKEINKPRLSDLTPEEDFILGAMLGYDIKEQCQRYLRRNHKNQCNTS